MAICSKMPIFAATICATMNKFEKTLRFIGEKINKDSPFYEQIYLVGGCVRDELLGERYTDLDLLINMPDGQKQFVEYMCATYPEVCKGPFYYQRYGTTAMDVTIDGNMTLVECVEPHIEQYDTDGVTLLETRFCTIEEDAYRRDYTCNALYKNLHTGEILDPTGTGIRDIKDKVLRTPAEPGMIYRQDPVRMLRGIRFKHQKNFALTEEAWQAIVENHDEMKISLPKRLRDELNKILKTSSFGQAINDLYISGLLKYVIPGLSEIISNPEPLPGTVNGITLWEHTQMALAVLLREHPHSDTLSKLTVLTMDIAIHYGKDEAAQLLFNAQIGKEKVASIYHYYQLYERFCRFYDNGSYVAKNRDLPRFINALASHKDDFRRMVRALNHGILPEYQLPWKIFYDNEATPESDLKHRRGTASRRRQTPKEGVTQENAMERQKERNHKRNIKRRDQRKRAKARARSQAAENQPDATAADIA